MPSFFPMCLRGAVLILRDGVVVSSLLCARGVDFGSGSWCELELAVALIGRLRRERRDDVEGSCTQKRRQRLDGRGQ